jgi:hypothetical protein
MVASIQIGTKKFRSNLYYVSLTWDSTLRLCLGPFSVQPVNKNNQNKFKIYVPLVHCFGDKKKLISLQISALVIPFNS